MVKVAFVGCGAVHRVHCGALQQVEGVSIVGHCDIQPDRAEDAASQYGGQAFTDSVAMFDQTKPGAVFICVPPYAHAGIGESAVERGIHLFIEAPLGLDGRRVKALGTALRKSKLLCGVGHNWRYYDTVERARTAIKGLAVSQVVGYWEAAMPRQDWWRCMAKSGGPLMEQAVHVFDLMRFLIGDVAEVYAVGASGCMTQVKDYSVHDSSCVALRFKNGATGAMLASCVSGHRPRVGVDIISPEAVFQLREGTLTVYEKGKRTEYLPTSDVFQLQSAAFVDGVRSGKRNRVRSTYADALRSWQISQAAVESIRSGLPVKL